MRRGHRAPSASTSPLLSVASHARANLFAGLHSLEAVAEQLQNASTTPQMQLFDHVVDVTLEPPKWLIEGILPEYAMTALVAPSYTGKSFVAVDIACAIANGLRWHDEFDVTHGNVFYVVGEGRHGIRRRVDAWHRKRGVTLTRETTNLHFSRQGLNFRGRSPRSYNPMGTGTGTCKNHLRQTGKHIGYDANPSSTCWDKAPFRSCN